jgi:hypothetical protein
MICKDEIACSLSRRQSHTKHKFFLCRNLNCTLTIENFGRGEGGKRIKQNTSNEILVPSFLLQRRCTTGGTTKRGIRLYRGGTWKPRLCHPLQNRSGSGVGAVLRRQSLSVLVAKLGDRGGPLTVRHLQRLVALHIVDVV